MIEYYFSKADISFLGCLKLYKLGMGINNFKKIVKRAFENRSLFNKVFWHRFVSVYFILGEEIEGKFEAYFSIQGKMATKEADPSLGFLTKKETKVKLARPTRVKNKTPAPIQITMEQILRKAYEWQEAVIRPPKQKIIDKRELADYRI